LRIAFISVHGCPLARLGERDTGGMNVFLREAAREFGRRGICVDIFTRAHDPSDPQIVSLGDNARVIHLSAGSLGEEKRALYQWLPDFSARLDEFIEEQGLHYDLVHSHYWLSGPSAAALTERWRVPFVASFHTLGEVQRLVRTGVPDAEERIATEQATVDRAQIVIAASPQEREQLIRLYGAEPEATQIVPCGFDPAVFRPLDRIAARRELSIKGPKMALFVGRIEPIKGIDVLLRAVAAMDDLDGVEVVVVGGNEADVELKRLKEAAAELGIRDSITFQPTVSQERLALYYNAADVCVVPSFYETFGLVALEAMACGTPVIAARVGGLESTVIDGETGYLVPWHCPEPYAERLETVLANDHLRERLGASARESVKGMTWPFVVDRLQEVYERALGSRAREFTTAGCA
jgi:D-inositol-3-phosphate glycosyltransferase